MCTKKILIVLTAITSMSLVACVASGALPDSQNVSVKNTLWSLVNLSSQALVPNTSITINFDNDRITGTDGCNRYNALYTLHEDRLNISRSIATTRMACPEPIMQQASSFISVVVQATRYKIDGSQLTLMDDENKPLAIFKK